MRRLSDFLRVSGLLATCLLAPRALAQDASETDSRRNTEEPREAAQAPVSPAAASGTPAGATAAPAAAAPAAEAAPKPKFGDVSVSGYFRAGFGASNQKGRMTCFALANPAGLISKYRLGNECEVWSETHFTVVTYVGDDGSVASLHFMPTVYIPTSYIGYSPNGAVNSPAMLATSTGAVLYIPNLYADIKGIPWLFGGTAWAGTRYYKRESIYISDFFYWNPSGVGAGIEDVTLGKIWTSAPPALKDMTFSYGAFAVDGLPGVPPTDTAPPLPNQIDFGLRSDFQIRGIRPWASGEFQLGFQFIANYSNNPATYNGWGGTFQYVQKVLGGDNKLAAQYGKGGGTGFGTLSRFYYPDFSVNHDLSEARLRILDVITLLPIDWFGAQANVVYQRDDNFLGSPGLRSTWWSTGGRIGFAPSKHVKLLGEAGYDRATRGATLQYLAKFTGAVALSADRGFWSRPELRVFATHARWNEAARTAGVDSGRIYTDTYTQAMFPNLDSGWIFGLQAETWW